MIVFTSQCGKDVGGTDIGKMCKKLGSKKEKCTCGNDKGEVKVNGVRIATECK